MKRAGSQARSRPWSASPWWKAPTSCAPMTALRPGRIRSRLMIFEVLYINREGELILAREEGVVVNLPIMAGADARLVTNRLGQIALYANASDQRYVHGIMGDRNEGATLLILEVRESQLRILARVDLPGEDVFEGIAPFWADIDGDGREDLVATVSNGTLGARLRAYLWDGARIREEVDGQAIGRGNRWRHQLSAGPIRPPG